MIARRWLGVSQSHTAISVDGPAAPVAAAHPRPSGRSAARARRHPLSHRPPPRRAGSRSAYTNPSRSVTMPDSTANGCMNIGPSETNVWNSPRSPQGSTSGGSAARKLGLITCPASEAVEPRRVQTDDVRPHTAGHHLRGEPQGVASPERKERRQPGGLRAAAHDRPARRPGTGRRMRRASRPSPAGCAPVPRDRDSARRSRSSRATGAPPRSAAAPRLGLRPRELGAHTVHRDAPERRHDAGEQSDDIDLARDSRSSWSVHAASLPVLHETTTRGRGVISPRLTESQTSRRPARTRPRAGKPAVCS